MADSPAFRVPLDSEEQPILDKLLVIRDKLLLLKSDRSQYVKSQDVVAHYDLVLEQIEALNLIRTNKRTEQNRVDRVLDDCLSLISLFFLTIGRNNEAPATYSLVATIKRLLDHLKEAGFFARADIVGLTHKLHSIQENVERGRADHNPHLITLLEARIETCHARLKELDALLSHLTPDLEAMHTKLVSILRSLSSLNTKSKFDARGVKDFQAQLADVRTTYEKNYGEIKGFQFEKTGPTEAIDRYAEKMREFMDFDERVNVSGKDVVRDLLERCYLWSNIILERQGKIDDDFKDTFDELLDIRNQLEKLQLTQAWSLRETDLYGYQRKLDRIDEARVDGNFVNSQGEKAKIYEHRTLLYLIRKSYSLIFFLMNSSEPVSEALLPIYNQLSTLKRCLVEVKRSGGVGSSRELYPYSMKLNSIDSMRKDGKFVVNGDIPEGQGSIAELLSECYDLAYELRADAEREDTQEAEDDEDDKDDTTAKNLAESVRNGIANMSVGVQ